MNKPREVDEESRRRIREELLTNMLVEAGAGSGKTQMIADRMAAGVASGIYPLERTAAVTFTRKAASELRGRLHLALEKELEAAHKTQQLDGRERIARIEDALSNLERFFAGTIHSFCARLLRERPVESGVAPGFTELDDSQDLLIRQRAWRDFVSGAQASGDPDLIALLDAGIRPQDLDSAFATICGNEDVDFPAEDGVCPNPAPALLELRIFWDELNTHLPLPIATESTCKIQQKAMEFRAQWHVSQRRLDRPSVVASLIEVWDCDSVITQKWWSDNAADKKRMRDLVQALHSDFRARIVQPYLRQWRHYVYCLSIGLLIRARNWAQAERRRVNALNYGDLLNLTARVLRGNPNVRYAFQRKFAHLLVDEFQDTDPIQAEILFWLAEDPSQSEGDNARDWRKVPLRKGALFAVGDPKQSIFRFRRADIDIYNLVFDKFRDLAVGSVLSLTRNFRSVPSLCTWANGVFANEFPVAADQWQPRFAPLDPERTEKSGGVYTITHQSNGKDVLAEDAKKIAAYIRSEVDSGNRKFSDFLILTRKKKARLAPYAHALQDANIPIEVSGAGAFPESQGVQTLITLLRALSDPQDPLPLVAVLRGDLFGVSDPELFEFKQAGGWFSIFCEAEATTEAASRVWQGLSALRGYYRWTRLLPAPAAIDRILEDSGYLYLKATAPGGVDAGDLLHAVDRVRQVTESGGSLADAADALEADADAASDVESLPLETGRTEVVRIMNLHKAKGLEAKVVFLADPAGGVGKRVDVRIRRNGLKADGWLKIIRRIDNSYRETLLGEPQDWPTHESDEIPYLEAEEKRLDYVAATRAREMLIISRCLGTLKQPAWGLLNNYLAEAKELDIPIASPSLSDDPLDCGETARTSAEAARNLLLEGLVQPSWSITSATAEARHIASMIRSVETAGDDPSRVVNSDTPTHRADAGHAWGTLIHGLLEHAMRHPGSTYSDLSRLATWLSIEEPDLRPVLDQAVCTVLEVSKADFWRKAELSEHAVETPFTFAGEKNELITGVIDLVFKDPESWHIIDYKTDVDLPNSSSSYSQQLRMYEDALSSVGVKNALSELQPIRLGSTSG